MTQKKLSVSIVIPNWNGIGLLKRHLPEVLARVRGHEVIIADDASDDSSVSFVGESFPEVKTVVNTRHSGFATTANPGVDAASGEVVILLNTDVVPHEGFIEPLVGHFRDPRVFAVGCMDISHEGGGTVERGRGLARWENGWYIHSRGRTDGSDTAWVSGGSGAFRKSVWCRLGGLDTVYDPFYWEDLDLSYRARKAGYRLVFEAGSKVDHYHEQGKIKRTFDEGYVRVTAYRNQFIFVWKNVTDTWLMLDHFVRLPYHLAVNTVRGDRKMMQGMLAAMLKIPELPAKRRVQSETYQVSDGVIRTEDRAIA